MRMLVTLRQRILKRRIQKQARVNQRGGLAAELQQPEHCYSLVRQMHLRLWARSRCCLCNRRVWSLEGAAKNVCVLNDFRFGVRSGRGWLSRRNGNEDGGGFNVRSRRSDSSSCSTIVTGDIINRRLFPSVPRLCCGTQLFCSQLY